ncbi:MAG: segregation and condensation protein A [Parcubacteria group bacterium Gr01-1014_70]|nr:MAG: segregation and condensation protein A [Parcubacteria group bacterium Gr01-1014_70]
MQVKTETFEGPLVLLLELIEKQKLSINTVSLAAIADAYVTEIKARSAIAPNEIANFLVVASTLMLIKSRSLLPQLPLTDEEEQSIQELEYRLQQLRRMRELSRHIAELSQAGNRMHERIASYELPVLFYPPSGITPAVLGERIAALIRALPIHASLTRLPEKAVTQIISLEDKIKELMERVEKTLSHSFKTLVGSAKEKSEIIVSFLALLELVKQGHILATQQNSFDDIMIISQK